MSWKTSQVIKESGIYRCDRCLKMRTLEAEKRFPFCDGRTTWTKGEARLTEVRVVESIATIRDQVRRPTEKQLAAPINSNARSRPKRIHWSRPKR